MRIISKYDMVLVYAKCFLDNRGVGYKCLICGREIYCEGNGWQGLGYMNIAMQSHMDKHYRHSEIPNLDKVTREV